MARGDVASAVFAALAVLLLPGCGGDGGNGTDTTDSAGAEASSAESAGGVTDANSHVSPRVAAEVAAMRAATAKYVDDLDTAIADGHFMITRHMTDQGYHFLNPDAPEEFDPSVPQILLYARDGDAWELVAFEWVWPDEPDEPPMDGATYGSFPAACHYADGRFVEAAGEGACTGQHPSTGAEFTFWHPDLVTLHVWAWLHNPDGLFHPTNPLMAAHNVSDGASPAYGGRFLE